MFGGSLLLEGHLLPLFEDGLVDGLTLILILKEHLDSCLDGEYSKNLLSMSYI